jgi:hypothetical protein
MLLGADLEGIGGAPLKTNLLRVQMYLSQSDLEGQMSEASR